MSHQGRLCLRLLFCCLAGAAYILPSSANCTPRYKAVKVDHPAFTLPYELNLFRKVVISPQGGNLAPLIWDQDTSISITVPATPYDQYFALSINDYDHICGDARKSGFSDAIYDVFLWDGSFHTLDVVPDGLVSPPYDSVGFSADINNVDDIVGTVAADSSLNRAVIWYGGLGKPVVLESLDDYRESYARAINDSKQVVVDAVTPRPANIATNRAYLWNQGSVTELQSLDGRAGSSTYGLDINSRGWVVGRSEKYDASLNHDVRATIWKNGSPIDIIGAPVVNGSYSNASAINDAGSVVISGGQGLLWEDGVLYQIDSLIENAVYGDGSPVPTIQAPLSINNNGDILTDEGALLIRQPEDMIVNSTGDAGDADPNDGRCYTGNTNTIGDDECTLRAAIQVANARSGRDSIAFNIPVLGVPSIKPGSALPTVTDYVAIKGETQPSSQSVEVSGESLPAKKDGGSTPIDGLKVTSGFSLLSSLIINKFSGNGITLQSAGDDTIANCIIGTNAAGDSLLGNAGNGILIDNSSNNLIGDYIAADSNTIAYNGGAGVFVQSGIENKISGNSIYRNGGLGIDLAPAGVTPNDSLDSDSGANQLTNFPVIDSVNTSGPQITIYGTLLGDPARTYRLEFFISDECDSSGYGEGRRDIGFTNVTPNFPTGIGTFAATFTDTLAGGQVLSATSTDDLGNTSEFSPCTGERMLRVIDYSGGPLRNKSLVFYKVANDPPTFTETLIDTFQTDGDGLISLTVLGLKAGDTLKVYKKLKSFKSSKHFSLLGTKATLHLDNAKFDSLGVMSYYEVTNELVQTTRMDHTTIAYNLVASIEWDASQSYLQTTMAGFRGMANYLYDVTDGQARLDTVMIFDNKEHWDEADITVYASNMVWPHVNEVGGIDRGAGSHADPIAMPRKFYGNNPDNRNMSYAENPLDMSAHRDFRTRAHEFGHYGIGFYDEYIFPNGGTRCSAHVDHTGDHHPYGYMDDQYEYAGPHASEMSGESAYSDFSCRNTEQWVKYGLSCWSRFHQIFAQAYDNIYAEIFEPNNRTLVSGLDYLPGPNDNLNSLDYDVGSMVIFPEAANPPVAHTVTISVASDTLGTPFKEASVVLVKPSEGRGIVEGKVDSLGRMRVLGVSTGDIIFSNGRIRENGNKKRATVQERWLYGQATAGATGKSIYGNPYQSYATDSMGITLNQVAGDYPLIASASINPTGGAYKLDALNMLPSAPSVELSRESDSVGTYSFTAITGGYTATISDSLYGTGDLTVSAEDDSGATFFFDTHYTTADLDSSIAMQVTGFEGAVRVDLDSSNTGLSSAIILSSPYPVIRDGLDPLAQQAGDAHALSVYPDNPLTGDNSIAIRYDESDILTGGGIYDDEASIRIFHWNDVSRQWELVGGEVDTVYNRVTAPITKTGVYAAFTTEVLTGVGENNGEGESGSTLPKHFELQQNYPNPFNPTTVISYSLPRSAEVSIEIYNILGQRVRTFSQGLQNAGTHSVTWNARDDHGKEVASGVYFYKITAGDFSTSKKMLLLK